MNGHNILFLSAKGEEVPWVSASYLIIIFYYNKHVSNGDPPLGSSGMEFLFFPHFENSSLFLSAVQRNTLETN